MSKGRFVFKASRDYLHSTTLFDRILEQTGPAPARVDFRFAKRTDRICTLVADKPADDQLVASYADSQRKLYAVETPEPITERVPYDEDALATHFTLEGRSLRVTPVPGYSFIECVVAGYKRLLISLYGKHRFAFVRLTLERLPQGPFTVSFVRELGGNFYQGKITEEGADIGGIFFGKWQ
ncbi:MAG TPA: hypothetical protein VHP13_06250 [Gammaproteobacteria bacterium]|nr:hypothetical protein [Gammaproteobacteria bacterium]